MQDGFYRILSLCSPRISLFRLNSLPEDCQTTVALEKEPIMPNLATSRAPQFASAMDPNTQLKVQTMSAGWVEYLKQAMNLGGHFQLAQGTLGLQTTDSSGLFAIADSTPLDTSVGYYDNTSNRRSSGYQLLLNALLPEANPNGLQSALGDMYQAWITWKSTNPPQSGETYLAYFKRWELVSSLDPGRAARAEGAIQSAQSTTYNTSWTDFNDPNSYQKFVRSDGTSFSLPVYTGNIQNAQAATFGTLQIDFDSDTQASSLSSTQISAAASGFYDIFSAGGSFDFSQLNTKAASSKFTIKGSVQFATLQTQAGGWYNGGVEVSRAYNNQGNSQVWDPGASAGNWQTFFGSNGILARYVNNLILVTNYNLTVTSAASYSQSDLQTIKAHARLGIWPFFSADASTSIANGATLNSQSQLTFTLSLPQGQIQIWGVTVIPAP
jgi:hypothetical protein